MMILDLGVAPAKPLSINEERKIHWAKRKARLDPWRDTTWALALEAHLAAAVAGRPCTITVHIPVTDKRRRDAPNFYPVVKACVDGLILAKVWADDTAEYVTVNEPVLQLRGRAAVHLEPREAS